MDGSLFHETYSKPPPSSTRDREGPEALPGTQPERGIITRGLIRLKRIYNFWCSMLVYKLFALCFVYTSWHFYAFSGTNLLTRRHSASSYFLLFLCFRKVTQEIFSELNEIKAEVPNYLTWRQSPKESRRRTKGQPHLVVMQATPRPRHQVVWPPGPPPNIALPPLYSLHRENPKGPNTFLENIL
jgi:hypothetical protein